MFLLLILLWWNLVFLITGLCCWICPFLHLCLDLGVLWHSKTWEPLTQVCFQIPFPPFSHWHMLQDRLWGYGWLYIHTLRYNIDKFAPEKSHRVTFPHSSPWFTDHLREMKSLRLKLECRWRKSGLTVHLQSFKEHQSAYSAALNIARSFFYATLIDHGYHNSRHIFSTINHQLKPSNFSLFVCNALLQIVTVF